MTHSVPTLSIMSASDALRSRELEERQTRPEWVPVPTIVPATKSPHSVRPRDAPLTSGSFPADRRSPLDWSGGVPPIVPRHLPYRMQQPVQTVVAPRKHQLPPPSGPDHANDLAHEIRGPSPQPVRLERNQDQVFRMVPQRSYWHARLQAIQRSSLERPSNMGSRRDRSCG